VPSANGREDSQFSSLFPQTLVSQLISTPESVDCWPLIDKDYYGTDYLKCYQEYLRIRYSPQSRESRAKTDSKIKENHVDKKIKKILTPPSTNHPRSDKKKKVRFDPSVQKTSHKISAKSSEHKNQSSQTGDRTTSVERSRTASTSTKPSFEWRQACKTAERHERPIKNEFLPRDFAALVRILKDSIVRAPKIKRAQFAYLPYYQQRMLTPFQKALATRLPRKMFTFLEHISADAQGDSRTSKSHKRLIVIINIFMAALIVSTKKVKFNRNNLRGLRGETSTESRELIGYIRALVHIFKTSRRSGIKGLVSLAKAWSINSFQIFANIEEEQNPEHPILSKVYKGVKLDKRFTSTMYGLSRSIIRGAGVDYEFREKYIETMCTPTKPVDKKLLTDLENFVFRNIKNSSERIVKFMKEDGQEIVSLADLNSRISIPTTACLENATNLGGSRTFLREKLIWRHTGVGEANTPKAKARRWADTLALEFQECYLKWSQTSQTGEPIPFAEPVAVAKPGGGTRMVTTCNAGLVHSLAPVNELLLRILRQFPECKPNLRGEDPSPYLRIQDDHVMRECYSADLSAASDHIPFEVSAAINKGIWKALNIRPFDPIRKLMTLASGPVHFVEHSGPKTCASSKIIYTNRYSARGLLMGMGLAWPYLNLLNIFASRTSRDHYGIIAEKERRSRDTVVAGDDLFGYWTHRRTIRYERTMKRLGLIINRKKTYRSETTGLFTENIIQVGKRSYSDNYNYRTIKFNTYNRLYLSQMTLAKNVSINGRPKDNTLPVHRTIGSCLRQVSKLDIPGWQKHRTYDMVEKLHSNTFSLLYRAHIPVYLPNCLGGAGGPICLRKYVPSIAEKYAASLILSNNQKEIRAQAMNQIGYFWKNAYLRDPLGVELNKARSCVEDLSTAKHPKAPQKSEVLQTLIGSISTLDSLSFQPVVPERQRLNVTYEEGKFPRMNSLYQYGKIANRWKQHWFKIARGIRKPSRVETIANKLYDIDQLEMAGRVKKSEAKKLIEKYRVPQVALFGRSSKTDHTPSQFDSLGRTRSFYRIRSDIISDLATKSKFVAYNRRKSVHEQNDSSRVPARPSIRYEKVYRSWADEAEAIEREEKANSSNVLKQELEEKILLPPQPDLPELGPVIDIKSQSTYTVESEMLGTRLWDRDAKGYNYDFIDTSKTQVPDPDREERLKKLQEARLKKKAQKAKVILGPDGTPLKTDET